MPVAPIRPPRLLEHARDLVEHHDGAGRPRPTWLRRAVSAAYYAAFHGVALATARQVLPNATVEDRYRLSRSVGHAAVREVCAWVERGTGKKHAGAVIAAAHQNASVLFMARLLQQLQSARHLADYDHLAPFGKAEALLATREAERVLGTLDSQTGQPGLEAFLALVALHTKLQ